MQVADKWPLARPSLDANVPPVTKKDHHFPSDLSKEQRIKVLLPLAVESAFDYTAGSPVPPPGSVVLVPLGKKFRTGVVWDDAISGDTPGHSQNNVDISRLKPIADIIAVPPMTSQMRRFIEWVARYTMAPPGAVLKMALPSQIVTARTPVQMLYHATGTITGRMTDMRKAVLAHAAQKPGTIRDIASRAGTSESVVRNLIKAGALAGQAIETDRPYPQPDSARPGPDLNDDQAKAARILTDTVSARAFSPVLLEGVTGSGKTEVYFEAIATALDRPQAQVLVLLPEIALTSQWLGRFEARFGVQPVEWHSDLSPAERRRAWHAVAKGSARVIVGPRSALFLPFADLSLIIVDEEHDPSFKQEDGVLYNARDMAVVRAQIEGVPIVLSTATPALETLLNAKNGRYGHVRMTARHGDAELPEIRAIDLRVNTLARDDWIAPPLVDAITATLERNEQCLLFLNRRGYAPLTLCRNCGARLTCPHCTAWLVKHHQRGHLLCHHCGFHQALPQRCPDCHSEQTLVACGPGVERVAEEVARRWPSARLTIMASDTITSPARVHALISQIESGAVDIIVGTQVITKGYHFPKLTLVGVIDADLGLRGSDLRAGERTWQQMIQVAGRAGRAQHKGLVFLQTYDPDHPVTDSLIKGDHDAFIAREVHERQQAGMPPFGRLASLILSSPDPEAVTRAAKTLAASAPISPDIAVYGPAPAPLARLRDQYRHRLLLKTARNIPIQTLLKDWLARVKLPGSVRLRVDIDPYSFL